MGEQSELFLLRAIASLADVIAPLSVSEAERARQLVSYLCKSLRSLRYFPLVLIVYTNIQIHKCFKCNLPMISYTFIRQAPPHMTFGSPSQGILQSESSVKNSIAGSAWPQKQCFLNWSPKYE